MPQRSMIAVRVVRVFISNLLSGGGLTTWL